ncbi:MAG: hypothetical protein AB7G22_03370 [Flavobacteriales bacterium]
MIDDNNIEDWYKDELSNYQVNPNDKGWDAIANKLDKTEAPLTEENIEDWYKNEAANYNATPDQQVWNKLSTKLDVENVWTRVLSSLNSYDRMIWWRNFGLRLSALIILFFGSYLTYNTINNKIDESKKLTTTATSTNLISRNNDSQYAKSSKKSTSSLVEKNNSTTKKEEYTKPDETVSTESDVATTVSVIRSNQRNNTIQTSSNNTSSNKKTPLYAAVKMDKYSPKQVGSLFFEYQEQELALTELQEIDFNTRTLEAKEFLVKKEKNKIIFNDKRFSSHFVFGMYARRFYVGVNAGFKKQDLFTKINTNNALSQAKQQRYLDFGYNIGGTIGFIMSDKLNLETNVNFISTSGYNRKYSLNDLTYSENLNLTYTTIDVMAKRMNNKSTFDNKKYSTNLIGGIYAGYLSSAEVITNGQATDVANQFNKMDLGIILGIEQDRYLSKQIMITPGIKYRQGLLNISDGNNAYQAARTFSVEFNIGIKYIFLKKN